MTDLGFMQFHVPTRICFGEGLARDFAAEWGMLGVSRPLIVTDRGLAETALVARVESGLRSAGATPAGRFTDVPPNSSLAAVEACAAMAREVAADSIVAVGGGSPIDTAKLAALLVTHGGSLVEDYAGAQTVPGPLMPLVVVPTTAGTGSEVTQAAVVSDRAHQTKLSFVDEHLRPRVAILDPELTVGLPPLLTAATGMDAITPAIEDFVDIQHGYFSDACALQTLHFARGWLARAVRDGASMAARRHMLAAATLAGIAFDHSMVGVVHAVSHVVGAMAHVHHGTANSILLPLGIRYNRTDAETEGRYALMARTLGLTTAMENAAATDALVAWLDALRTELHEAAGLPRTLAEAGVDRVLLPEIARLTPEDGASFYNPRPVEEETIHALLEEGWGEGEGRRL